VKDNLSPFQIDMLKIWVELTEWKDNFICYFFGHDWETWGRAYHSPISEIRQCKRCLCFDHR
jgi:hypothetical protein